MNSLCIMKLCFTEINRKYVSSGRKNKIYRIGSHIFLVKKKSTKFENVIL